MKLPAKHQISIGLLFLLTITSLHSIVEAAELRAGAHIQPISPTKFPAPVNGGMKGNFATSVHDHMQARCIAIQDGTNTILLCVIDACMVPREVCEQAKEIVAEKTGVPRTHMLISATHTHSAATLTPVFQSDADPEYVASVPARIAQGMIQSFQNLEPAEIGWSKASNAAQVFNRRWLMKEGETYVNPFGVTTDRVQMNPGHRNAKVEKPSGPVDPEVCVLAVRSKTDHRPLAMLANYSLHYVGGNPPISADYFAVFADEVGQRLKTADERFQNKVPFVAAMSNGTSGNINNVDYSSPAPQPRPMPGEQLRKVAASVAETAIEAYNKISFHSEVSLDAVEDDLTLKVRKASASELETAKKVLETTPKDKDGQFSDRTAIYAREAVALDAYPDTVPVKLQVLKIGELSIAAIPCEVFVEIGLQLKQESPFAQHFTISLANGYNGYLPTAQHHQWGGYETWRARSSYLEVSAADQIIDRLNNMLRELKKRS
jgi:neutral ceramidase